MDRTGAARIGWNDLPPGHTSSLPSQAICRLQACLQVLYFSFSLHPLLQTSIGNPVGFLSSLCVCVCVGVCVCVYVGLCGCVPLFLFWGSGCATVKGEMVGG